MSKNWLIKGTFGLLIVALVFIFNYFVRVDLSWRLRSAEARSDRSGPQSTIHLEETRPLVNMQEETYILYSDLDGDGDLDIAYTTNSPIKFIENRTLERGKN